MSAFTDHSPAESAHPTPRPADPPGLSAQDIFDILLNGEMTEAHGLMPWSSNYTFLVTVRHGEVSMLAVYKPVQGETPLWDFPQGNLALREVAAYMVSHALGWDFVPPTVLRDGRYGPGAVQMFIDHDFNEHYFTMREQGATLFQYVAAFDIITNNADRKAGHFLRDAQGRVWAVDHGLTFHADPKLRTVVWDFADQPIPQDILDGLRRLLAALRGPASPLLTQMARLISEVEIKILRRRVGQLVRTARFPLPGPGRSVPFPPL